MSTQEVIQAVQTGKEHITKAPLGEAKQSFERGGSHLVIQALEQALGMLSVTRTELRYARTLTNTSLADGIYPMQDAFRATQGSENPHVTALNDNSGELSISALGQLWNSSRMMEDLDVAQQAVEQALAAMKNRYTEHHSWALRAATESVRLQSEIITHADGYLADIAPGAAPGEQAI